MGETRLIQSTFMPAMNTGFRSRPPIRRRSLRSMSSMKRQTDEVRAISGRHTAAAASSARCERAVFFRVEQLEGDPAGVLASSTRINKRAAEGTQTAEKLGGSRVTQFSIFCRTESVRCSMWSDCSTIAGSMCSRSRSRIAPTPRSCGSWSSDPEPFAVCFRRTPSRFGLRTGSRRAQTRATELGRLLAALLAAECNIFGSYALLTRPRGKAPSRSTSRITTAPSPS